MALNNKPILSVQSHFSNFLAILPDRIQVETKIFVFDSAKSIFATIAFEKYTKKLAMLTSLQVYYKGQSLSANH
jgi:hypothetical protein